MNNPKGLKKGLVQQWNAATSPMEKFAFLKAFLLDKEMGSIQVDAMSETKDKEKFIELPLCEIMERWGKLPGGEQFVKDIQASQTGKRHPQTSDPNWRIYRVFKELESSSILAAYLGNIRFSIMLVSLTHKSLSKADPYLESATGLRLRSSSPTTGRRGKRLQRLWREKSGIWGRARWIRKRRSSQRTRKRRRLPSQSAVQSANIAT
ncbi:unnamed protein product [Symbiodinium necroappetens]|uniref:Uncharacterized protein n=1 Tax=Symbiodinium necroappetens TaxID=1628268 RepID=A0A813AUF0_9DINO|nr:unnamed protein product [Symbiodinium necroappetens]